MTTNVRQFCHDGVAVEKELREFGVKTRKSETNLDQITSPFQFTKHTEELLFTENPRKDNYFSRYFSVSNLRERESGVGGS